MPAIDEARRWLVKRVVTTTYTYGEIEASDADKAILLWTNGAGELSGSTRDEEVVTEEVETHTSL